MRKGSKRVRTKIIATMGPSTDSATELRKMILAGLDVVRLNFSHGTWQEHENKVALVRALNSRMRRAVGIMQDLEGFRMRVGKLKKPLPLKKRQVLYLTQDEIVGQARRVHFDYTGSLKSFKKGVVVYIDDGKLMLRVREVGKRCLKTEVMNGGVLKTRKGINIPDVDLAFPALTEKDERDVEFTNAHGLDYVAPSFVRGARDVRVLRRHILARRPKCRIFSKIESREALKNIDAIIAESDGIIVARGDLGICVPIHQVPVIQKELIKRCRKARKLSVVATQMLDSMTQELLPTRAEVTDVANAIIDGADYVLLSAETAVGSHPARVIDMMNKIIKYTERYQKGRLSVLG
ncbi:MAG: pyruvate kinase [Elusimicrobiota bacterium]